MGKPAQLHIVSSLTSPVDGMLYLAENLTLAPDTLIGNGNGIAGFGVQGSGKTGILARILEQAARFHVPFAALDKEGDLLSVVSRCPRGVLATRENCPTGADILEHGLQCVFDLASWSSTESAGQAVAHIVRQLLFESDAVPRADRVPCLVALDEAEYWLPQKRSASLSEDTYILLYDAFHGIATRGRKRGLTPVLFTQQIAALHKDVLAPGVFIFGRQTIDTSLKRYMEYLTPMGDLTEKQFRQRLTRLPAGRAIVKLPDGSQKAVQFYERESEHLSHTPKVQAAIHRYANKPMPALSFGEYQADADLALPDAPVSKKEQAEKSVQSIRTGAAQRLRELLCSDASLRPCQLAKLANCDVSQAAHARTRFLDEQAVQQQKGRIQR